MPERGTEIERICVFRRRHSEPAKRMSMDYAGDECKRRTARQGNQRSTAGNVHTSSREKIFVFTIILFDWQEVRV